MLLDWFNIAVFLIQLLLSSYLVINSAIIVVRKLQVKADSIAKFEFFN